MTRMNFQNALIVGAGVGLSASLARLFAKQGWAVSLAARTPDALSGLCEETGAQAFQCDAADEASVCELFKALDDEGRVPGITPGEEGLAEWSQSDIAYYLASGFTPDFDTVGGSMVEVQENMAQLSEEDREAIAAYLINIPPLD